ncbi:MAG: hypothetical protein R3E32_00245 [Chitinophagales bacterium]
MPVSSILKNVGLFAAIIGLGLGILHYLQLLGSNPDFAWICFVFFTILTFLTIYITSLSAKASSKVKGTTMILGAMGIKFIFSMFMILAYLLAVSPDSPRFILPFFVLYILFTVVETNYLLKITKGQ